jgi:hypothetical protein
MKQKENQMPKKRARKSSKRTVFTTAQSGSALPSTQ